MTNIIIHGIRPMTCCCAGSIALGCSLNWAHIVTPKMIASTPMPRKLGGVKGSRPNRLSTWSGSGADKSLIHSTKGW